MDQFLSAVRSLHIDSFTHTSVRPGTFFVYIFVSIQKLKIGLYAYKHFFHLLHVKILAYRNFIGVNCDNSAVRQYR